MKNLIFSFFLVLMFLVPVIAQDQKIAAPKVAPKSFENPSSPLEANFPREGVSLPQTPESDNTYITTESAKAIAYLNEINPHLQEIITANQQVLLSARKTGTNVQELEEIVNPLIRDYNELQELSKEISTYTNPAAIEAQSIQIEEIDAKIDRLDQLAQAIVQKAEQIKSQNLLEKALEAETPVLEAGGFGKDKDKSKERQQKKEQRSTYKQKSKERLNKLEKWMEGLPKFLGAGGFGKDKAKEGVNKESKNCLCSGQAIKEYTCLRVGPDGKKQNRVEKACSSKVKFAGGKCNTKPDCDTFCRNLPPSEQVRCDVDITDFDEYCFGPKITFKPDTVACGK